MPDDSNAADLSAGDIVEVLDLPDMPWPQLVGARGVVHYVSDDPGDPNVIVLFERQDMPGVTSRKHHFRKVEE